MPHGALDENHLSTPLPHGSFDLFASISTATGDTVSVQAKCQPWWLGLDGSRSLASGVRSMGLRLRIQNQPTSQENDSVPLLSHPWDARELAQAPGAPAPPCASLLALPLGIALLHNRLGSLLGVTAFQHLHERRPGPGAQCRIALFEPKLLGDCRVLEKRLVTRTDRPSCFSPPIAGTGPGREDDQCEAICSALEIVRLLRPRRDRPHAEGVAVRLRLEGVLRVGACSPGVVSGNTGLSVVEIECHELPPLHLI